MSSAVNGGPVGPHGPGHRDCPACDLAGTPDAGTARVRPRVVRVAARGEEFKIVQLAGNLFVCSRANGNCCCGWAEKGRAPFDNALWSDEWERRKIRNRVHLTFSGCLGPGAVGNNALLQIHDRSIWFKDLNDPSLAPRVFDYIEAMLAAGTVLPVPGALDGHVYERYLTPQDGAPRMTFGLEGAEESLDGLDPVCLMTVDLATAKHTVEHAGRTYAFCAPACKKMFLADPEGYVSGEKSTPMRTRVGSSAQ